MQHLRTTCAINLIFSGRECVRSNQLCTCEHSRASFKEFWLMGQINQQGLISRPRQTSVIYISGLSKRLWYCGAASEASKTGGPGAHPLENLLKPRPFDRWKTPLLYKLHYLLHKQIMIFANSSQIIANICKLLMGLKPPPALYLYM